MKYRCTAEMLGLVPVNGDQTGTRFKDNNWREVTIWEDPCGTGLHVDPFLPSWASRCGHCGCVDCANSGTFGLVSACIETAKNLGFDAWMCDNNPKNGGWIQHKDAAGDESKSS